MATEAVLAALGVRVGEEVRYRRRPAAHWSHGVVTGLEGDGSLGVRDEQGRARALRPEVVEVRRTGRGGAAVWESLLERAHRHQQLGLWEGRK